MIPYGRQQISEEDILEVESVLRSDFLTQGPAVPRFEEAFAIKVGAAHCVAVNSATSALHIACLALDVGPGDQVWTTPNSFVASSNCALYCGASVDFVDIDRQTLCMSSELLERKLTEHRAGGKAMPKVVIPVHFAGQSCDMAEIARLAKEYGFRVIEDASHAAGARYKAPTSPEFQPVGCCQFSDICVFSFHPVKIITTGEGGMATTNSRLIAQRLQMLRTHGITRDPEMFEDTGAGLWHYEMHSLGLNYRMTDISAALGRSQLRKLAEFVSERQKIATFYFSSLSDVEGLTFQLTPAYTESARHLFVVHVPSEVRRGVFEGLRSSGIGVNLHYIPITEHPYYRKLGFNTSDYPNSEWHFKSSLSLPIFPGLDSASLKLVVRRIRALMD